MVLPQTTKRRHLSAWLFRYLSAYLLSTGEPVRNFFAPVSLGELFMSLRLATAHEMAILEESNAREEADTPGTSL